MQYYNRISQGPMSKQTKQTNSQASYFTWSREHSKWVLMLTNLYFEATSHDTWKYISKPGTLGVSVSFGVIPWWRHQMETFSALLAIFAGNSPVPGEFPTQRPDTRSFDVFFDLSLNKRLSKQSWSWWFHTPSCPLWRHSNDLVSYISCHPITGSRILHFTYVASSDVISWWVRFIDLSYISQIALWSLKSLGIRQSV